MAVSTIQLTWMKKDGATMDSTMILVPMFFQGHLFSVHCKQVNSDQLAKNWCCRDPKNETFFLCHQCCPLQQSGTAMGYFVAIFPIFSLKTVAAIAALLFTGLNLVGARWRLFSRSVVHPPRGIRIIVLLCQSLSQSFVRGRSSVHISIRKGHRFSGAKRRSPLGR